MIHIYCGDGKGKTTCAFGLALRAAGRGRKVLITQFLKSGDSASVPVLCVFDSEEVGSVSPQGAGSSLLEDTLGRICDS